jgi:hypothetical protein
MIVIDRIAVPNTSLRRSWRHGTGKYGLSEIGTAINNVIVMSNRLLSDPHSPINIKMYYQAVFTYFNRVSKMLGTKRGDISTYGMSVRYPYSAKGVATLSNNLPKNTIEIHKSMAKDLDVQSGDIIMAERFPCLGFMSLRPQKVKVTSDPKCRFTIRVSGNCLGSMGLDFDGDVLFIASFHSEEAVKMLKKEWTNPDETCYTIIKKYNKQKDKPRCKEVALEAYEIIPFNPLTIEQQAGIVEEISGVKAYTGPVIAFLYNLMRVIENSGVKSNKRTAVGLEEFFTIVGESVFDLKHGLDSPHEIFVDAVCTGDIKTLVDKGFDRSTSTIICTVVKEKALQLGVTDMFSYHERAKAIGGNIVSRIVREQNKIYFASRAKLESCKLIDHLKHPAVDIPSKILRWTLSGQAERLETIFDKKKCERRMASIKDDDLRSSCKKLCDLMDVLFAGEDKDTDLVLFNEMHKRRTTDARRRTNHKWKSVPSRRPSRMYKHKSVGKK